MVIPRTEKAQQQQQERQNLLGNASPSRLQDRAEGGQRTRQFK